MRQGVPEHKNGRILGRFKAREYRELSAELQQIQVVQDKLLHGEQSIAARLPISLRRPITQVQQRTLAQAPKRANITAWFGQYKRDRHLLSSHQHMEQNNHPKEAIDAPKYQHIIRRGN